MLGQIELMSTRCKLARRVETENCFSTCVICVFAALVLFMPACFANDAVQTMPSPAVSPPHASVAKQLPEPNSAQYKVLHQKIAYGKASLAEIRMALTENNSLALANVMQALYAMRWHRGVIHLLNGLWELDKDKYPELAWKEIEIAPTRIALASTLNRIRIVGTEPYLDYIRQHIDSDNNLIGAQVAVALGFNGESKDLEVLEKYSAGDNPYIAQSAITGLGLFGSEQAQNILITLLGQFKESNRGNLIREVLQQGYKWPPAPLTNPLPQDQASAN